ncbi:phosphonate C-P lyase system protein PhnH [Maritalea sp.]|uniref:phosphonate C-P lyase system protein PhnH n=1 Tax=Maritalea sp. TaxID=2003361 RepID=UPI003EF1018C
MQTQTLHSGFSDLAIDSQASFRATMDAMARPGKIVDSPKPITAPAPLNPTMAMLTLTLCDFDSTVWLDENLAQNDDARKFIAFHTSAPIVESKKDAQFALISEPTLIGNLSDFALGTDEYPDRSTTLIIQVDALANQNDVRLSGPGIEFTTDLNVAGLPNDFWTQAQANNQLFPRGLDFIFATDSQLACLPRSTKINLNAETA